MPTHSNRLALETSPYLRQHGHNPVDWYPWGAEALERAKREDKPILLSIGYSACHWCHVMERESFENEDIARLMNASFINIKVDREERPDLDHIYMNAVQMMSGRGGWPLTMFLTPDGKPFYGGTYFPPQDRYNIPGFPRVLAAVAQAYREKHADIDGTIDKLLTGLAQMEAYEATPGPLDPALVARAAEALSRHYDPEHGGFGGAPKFPNESVLELFLRHGHADGDQRFVEMVTHTLRRMAAGGIYDHLGGGFHRYSVDAHWLVPHFEKMLYDNAQLASLYLDVYRATGERFFADVAEDILVYVLREMRHPEGGFYSTQDADSEGEEGKFFVWTPAEVRQTLGEDADLFCRFYDVTDAGNFEHRNILHRTLEIEPLARLFRLDAEDVRRRLGEARRKLFAVREKRVKPGLDDKALTAWNALMIGAFAQAASALGNETYLAAARQAVEFVFNRLWSGDRLLCTYKDGKAKLNAYLDDYAFLAAALLDLFEASQEEAHLARARQLADILLERFWDAESGGFFFTSSDHEKLLVRSKPAFDGSIPSGNSVAARMLLRLHHFTGETLYLERAEQLLHLFYGRMHEQPFGLAHMIGALDFYLRKPKEVVVVGPATPERRDMVQRIARRYLPNRVLRVADPAAGALPPILQGKGQVDGKLTVYVCEGMTCSLPATTWEQLEKLL
jgi:uncharacterized protein